jgi:hypothetical protein
MTTMHVPYRSSLAEGMAAELERSLEIYDPKIFKDAVTALFEQRSIAFTE